LASRTPVAFGAAAAIGFGILFGTTPAMAAVEEPAEVTVETSEGIYDAPVSSVSGTGEPGATIALSAEIYDFISGDMLSEQEIETVVGEDGAWAATFAQPLTRGDVVIDVSQRIDDVETSYDYWYSFVITPSQITSIPAGAQYIEGTAPSTVSGTFDADFFLGVVPEGLASITLAVGDGSSGDALPVTLNEDGTWTAELAGPLTLGDWTIALSQTFTEPETQEVNFLTNPTISVAVVAEQAPAPAPAAPAAPEEELAATGADADEVLPFAATGAALLVAGIAAIAFTRRKAVARG